MTARPRPPPSRQVSAGPVDAGSRRSRYRGVPRSRADRRSPRRWSATDRAVHASRSTIASTVTTPADRHHHHAARPRGACSSDASRAAGRGGAQITMRIVVDVADRARAPHRRRSAPRRRGWRRCRARCPGWRPPARPSSRVATQAVSNGPSTACSARRIVTGRDPRPDGSRGARPRRATRLERSARSPQRAEHDIGRCARIDHASAADDQGPIGVVDGIVVLRGDHHRRAARTSAGDEVFEPGATLVIESDVHLVDRDERRRAGEGVGEEHLAQVPERKVPAARAFVAVEAQPASADAGSSTRRVARRGANRPP